MSERKYREIPFNYTSADDERVVRLILGDEAWEMLEQLRSRRVTGRSARLLMRLIGELFIIHRNPFVFEELLESKSRRRQFFASCRADLDTIRKAAHGEAQVLALVTRCTRLLDDLESSVRSAPLERERVRKVIGGIVGPANVFFDPFSLISHATDATDWRLFLPFAVVCPDDEVQVAGLLRVIGELGYRAIPRGAGTGLTGGGVPVAPDCVMINTEKLNRIRGIHSCSVGQGRSVSVIEVEAGVVTEDAMRCAEEAGLVFATDPTSSWASTIGGNIAENAGGKTAVLWGTAIDNLFSFRIAMPDGRLHQVRRIDHPLRKIRPNDTVVFEVDVEDEPSRRIRLQGKEIRKPGLWKDITNKALGGLPGIQKEGTDGVITSAEFVLHPRYPLTWSFCLEFFGESFDEAARVICALAERFPNRGEEALIALEHFDEEYVRAIGYKVKAARSERPKAVLLIDMVGYSESQLERGERTLRDLLEHYPNTHCVRARDAAEAARFWKDRKSLGAIAARTNAFKLNEDIVLPLDALAEFSRFVETRNTEEERFNQKAIVDAIESAVIGARIGEREDPQWFGEKLARARELADEARRRLFGDAVADLRSAPAVVEFMKELQHLFAGYSPVLERIESLESALRARLIVIATHMHAGDGNVHVNIPVFSNDREMMSRAARAADDVMSEAVRLGGVVSGEHGIGFTKLKYLDSSRIEELNEYRRKVDPAGLMNPGKLCDPTIPAKVFTPSFNLLELEARILQHGSLEQLSEKIATCVRCGRCKANCCVFYPAGNLFFHPRNKNLAIAAVVEALLYDTQRSHSTRFDALAYLESIADHCTICHKCLDHCPVRIDTGFVSILEREILAAKRHKRTALVTGLSLRYLESRSPSFNRFFRKTVLEWGGRGQRLGARLAHRPEEPPADGGWAGHFLSSPLPLPSRDTLRDYLPGCRPDQAVVVRAGEGNSSAVFYFPGCGSERLFSDIGAASIYLLLKCGCHVVIPPPYLCCGFPQKANAQSEQHERIALRNTIIFSQIREMFSYLDFEACTVSCGTCMESVRELAEVFDCALEDVSRFSLARLDLDGENRRYLYHAPCHDSLEGTGADLLTQHLGAEVRTIPHCCSQAGTLALSRPDLAERMLRRKAEAVESALGDEGQKDRSLVLTNCPSCLQGLGRLDDSRLEPRHLAVELAWQLGGEDWRGELRRLLVNSEVVPF
jgi:FAD/FMN-containing dehydrogenase/Fe-S oxidoreductase